MIFSTAIDCCRAQSVAIEKRWLSKAFDGIRSVIIGSIRLLSLAIAFTASADEALFGGFVPAVSQESAAVRLEARSMGLVAPRVVAGTQTLISSNGLTTTAWNTTALANGWHEMQEPTGGDKVSLLVANLPSIAVEGGRLQSNATWTSNAVHWVRHRVVVPDGVTLTVREGAIVKFGEDTGITVEKGGTLNFTGKSNARIVLTSFADDVYGGDSDFGVTNATYGTWSISAMSGATISDAYTHVRYGTLDSAPTVSLPVTVTAQRTDGKARIPVSFSGTRDNRFSLHWRTVDGTAKYGTDFTLNEGEAVFSNTSATTGYFEIPLVVDAPDGGVKDFSVELVSVEDANPNPSCIKTTVVIVTGNPFPSPVWAESELSEGIRLENRDPDPKPEPVPATMAIEGGRLLTNATWPTAATNFVLNTVVVPEGVTLTVVTNATVFFAPHTGIKVEKGGTLRVVGSVEKPVVFTAAENGDYAMTVLEGGTFTDSYAQFEKTTYSAHPTVSIPGGCEVSERNERVQIPVNVSGSRASAFRVKWRATDGTAKFGEDYTLASGEVEWSGTSEGTKYITISIPNDGVEEESETFIVELYAAQGANLGTTTRCTVLVRDGTAALVPVAISAESDTSEAVRLENRDDGTIGKAVVCGTEYIAADGDTRAVAWDSTQVADGWQANGLLVRNSQSIAIEGGRLLSNTTWTSNATHLVRNWVVVPTNITLTVVTNAVVKFCENTGVKVEAGGRFELLGSLDENVYMTLANDDTVGGDTDKDEGREWADGAATYSISVISGGTFTDMNSAIRGTTIDSFGSASVNAKTVVDASEGVIRIPVFINGSRTTQFSVDWKTSDGLTGRLIWANANEGTKWVTLNVADCSETFTFELCECRGININGSAKTSEVTVFRNATPLAVCAESESSEAVRFENRAADTFGRALCVGTEWKSADDETRAEEWDTTKTADGWQDGLLVLNDASVAVEGGRLFPTYEVVNTNGVDVTNWNYTVNWTSDKVHVVRNWVVVPNGMTLSIAAGTVVKFAEFTGFKVESGGRLSVNGTVDAPVVYTSAADDTIGGDTDRRDKEPQYGDYSINIVSGGTYSDRNCAVRYATFSNLGTATLPATAVANEKDGVVRVPLFISTSRTTAFCVDWRVASGTYATQGRVNWNTYTEGTKFIEIQLTPGTVAGDFDTFEIEMYESQGINVSTTQRKCVVTVYPDKTFPAEIAFADSDDSESVRLENRDLLWSYGAEIVCGTEWKSANGESRAEQWDTTQEEDGWLDVVGDTALQLLVRNDESIAVEGGRLGGTMTWGKDKVHVVRNWVVVPNGVTLTITAGTIVKFCDETGIKVEAGGRLVSAGTAANDVIFTSVNDDMVGGDTDLLEEEPLPGDYNITVISGGTFTDTYTQMRYGTSGTFGSVSVPAKVVAKKDSGIVRIPVSISSSRTTPFAVDWVAYDNGATAGEDYLLDSGRIEWTGSSQGTKYLEIPLDRMAETSEDEGFVIELVTGLGINLNLSSVVCEVDLYDTRDTLVGSSNGYAESEWCEFTTMDSMVGVGPMFAMGEVPIRYSTLWAGVPPSSAAVTVTDAEKKTATLADIEGSDTAEGYTTWNGADYEDGRYDLMHKIFDADGRMVKVDSATFIVNRDVVEHGGRVAVDETWTADKVHLVVSTVTVPSGVTLTIAPDAIVKFMPGTSIVVERGGLGICKGAVLTHAYDDVMGGDTFFDGAETVPEDGGYSLSGDWEDDESTQYRYSMPLEVSGTLKGENRWPGHKTYIVTGNITLASGATLTIEAGAVVKFQSLKMLTVNSGATLNALGTRSAPVVFTSIKDDDFGGDTNGDGDASVPQPGDWEEIKNNGGTIRFEYVKARYGGYGQYTNQGDAILRVTGGTTTLYGCMFEQSQFRLIYRSGGAVKAENCVLEDARTGIDGGVTFVNGVISKCNTAATSGTIKNSILWKCDAYGSASWANCVAYDGATSVPNGVIYVDPRFENAEKGDFRIKADSPCVDAGDGMVASEKDYYNQPRQTIQGVEPTGTLSANGAYADIGIYEVQPRIVESDIDLEVKSVIAPESMTVGELVTVSWREANIGSVDTDGKWYDKVELVSANGAVVLLGTVPVTGIPAGGEKTITESSFRVPAIAGGACFIRVTANCNRDIYEGSLTANNVCLSDETTVSVAGVDFTDGDVARVKLLSEQQTSYQMAGLPTGGCSLLIHSATGESFGAYVAFGKMPTTYANASSFVVLPNGDVLVSVLPHSADETVYLLLDSTSKIQNGVLDVTVNEDYPAIYALSKESMPNTGSQSLVIYGVGMDEVARVALFAADGTTIDGTSVRAANACELSASFALTGAKTGAYRVVVTAKDGKTAGSATTVSIISHANAKAKLEISLDAPSAIRQNRWYEAVVTVRNAGDADSRIPIIVLNGSNIEFRDPDGSLDVRKGVLQLLPLNPAGDPLVLPPDSEVKISVVYRFTLSTSRNTLRYGLLNFDDAGWTSFISKGGLSDVEWEEALSEYSAGFDSPVAFLSTVYDRASQFKTAFFRPTNAFRLYGIVQAEKNTERRSGMVTGIALDESGSPMCNLKIGIGNLDDNDTVYVTTDADGLFVAYGVWPGEIAFTADDYNIVPEENVDLVSGGIANARLTCMKIADNPHTPNGYFKEYNRMSKLTLDSSSFIWIDGFGRLLIGDPRNGSDALTLSGGAYAEYYRVVSVDGNSAVVAAMISHDGLKSLRVIKVCRDMSGGFSEVLDEEVSDSVLGLSSLSCEDGIVNAIVRVKDEVLGTSAFSVLTCDTTKTKIVKTAKLRGGDWMPGDEEESASFVLDTGGLLGCDFKNFNVSLKPYTDTGVQPQGCCKWYRESSWGVSAGVEIPISADGSWTVPVSAGGGQTKKWSYYCQKAMGAGGSCAEEDMMLTACSEKSSIEVQGGIKYTFPLNTEYIVKNLKGMGYKIGRNIPINLNVSASGTLTGDKSHDKRERHVPRSNGSTAYFFTEDDDFSVRLQIEGNATANLGLAQFEGGGGRGRKKRDISVNTSGNEDVPLEAHGEIHLEAHYDRHYRNGSLRSQNGGGSLGGEVRVLSLMGTLSGHWDAKKGFYGEWKYNFFNKNGEGNTLKSPQHRSYAVAQATKSSGAGRFMFPSEKVDDTLTLAAWGVHLDAARKMAIGCREYVLDGNIRRGLFIVEAAGGEERRISSDKHDVGWCSRLIEFDGTASVYYIASVPDFTGDADDLMVSYAHSRLYRLDCVDGVWGDPVAVVADGNWSQGGVSVSDQIDGCVMVAFKSSTVLTDIDGTGNEKLLVVFDDGNRGMYLKTTSVADVKGMTISSLVPYFTSEGKRLLYSIAKDDENDEIIESAYDESSGAWVKCENAISELAESSDSKDNATRLQSMHANTANGVKHSLMGASSCGTCVKGCHCHCNDGNDKNPGDGCGCPIKCECKGLCSLGECKCWDGHHDMDQPRSYDPNEMVGPAGVGEERYVKPGEPMDYTIYFENQTNATAAAQDVYVTLPKDAGLDWSTFRLGEVVFGDNIDTALSGFHEGESTYALPGTNWSVRTEVTHTADAVKWHLRIIDPTTSDKYPSDPYAGFLPPNDETGRGEGHLRFSVNVKEDASPGAIIKASAVIEFDPLNGNKPIETDPAWSNTVAVIHSPTLDLGDGVATNLTLIAGRPFGELPTPPERKNWKFGGWYTGPNGTGIKVEPDTVVPDGDFELYANWLVDGGVASFIDAEIFTEEGSNAVVCVSGGNAEKASSVKVYLTYNTAVAADLDLAKGEIDDETPKGGLKFPLTLSWEAGEIGEKVVTIPVKTDKTVEDDEFFTLQLAEPVGMELGEGSVCTVTIHDPGYDDIAAKVAAGTATKAEKSAWDKLQKAKAPYVRGLADPANAGKVSGSGLCAAGKKVTLKATANKGFVFLGWTAAQIPLDGDRLVIGAQDYVATTASLVIDRTAKPAKDTATSTTITGVDGDVTYYANFITSGEDAAAISLSVNDGTSLGQAASQSLSTNVMAGVALSWPVAADALTATTINVSGLPAGLKFTAKDILKKGSKDEVEIPANTIYGAPTAASAIDKKTGLPKPSEVKITVTTAGKSSVTYLVKLTVDPLPAWAVGAFEGAVEEGTGNGESAFAEASAAALALADKSADKRGTATLTIAATGKIAGKFSLGGTNWTFKADSYAAKSETVGTTNFVVSVVATAGKAAMPVELSLSSLALGYLPASATACAAGSFGDFGAALYRLVWADKGDSGAAACVASYAGAYSFIAAYGDTVGDVAFTLSEKGAAKGTAVLPDGAKTRKATFSANALPEEDGLHVVVAVPADTKKGCPAVFEDRVLVPLNGEADDIHAYRDPGAIVVATELNEDSGASGTVAVSPKYGQVAAGKTVTLTAKADKGSVFSCWEIKGVDTTGLDLSAATLKYVSPGYGDVTAVAKFITAEEDKANIKLNVDGVGMEAAVSSKPPYRTNVWAGVYLEWPVVADALSATTVKVAGLPSGLKFADKPVTTKTGSGKTAIVVTNVPANTIYGAPTAASKTKTDRGTGKVTVTPSAVKVTVTTAGKSSQTYQIDTVVDALPAWAVGSFAGELGNGELGTADATAMAVESGNGESASAEASAAALALADKSADKQGTVSLTVSAAGKVSGKALSDGLTYALAAPYYSGFDVASDGEVLVSNFLADVTASWSYKEGSKTVKTNDVVQITVRDNGIGGFIETALPNWRAWQYNWKVERWSTLGKSFDKKTMSYVILADGTVSDDEQYATAALGEDVIGRVTLKFTAKGTATVAGEFVSGYDEKKQKYTTVKASGTATLAPIDGDCIAVFVYLTPKNLSPHARCLIVSYENN